MGWSWKGAARGALGSYIKKRENENDLATQLALAKAKGGGAESSLGKLMYDMFGAPAGGGYTPEQWKQAQEMHKGASHAPAGSPSMELPGLSELIAERVAQMRKKGGVSPQVTPQISPAPQAPPGKVAIWNPLTKSFEYK